MRGIEAGTGNDVIGGKERNWWRVNHVTRRWTGSTQNFIEVFMASMHCLCVPVVLLMVDWQEEVESGWCRTNLLDEWAVTRNESCVDG